MSELNQVDRELMNTFLPLTKDFEKEMIEVIGKMPNRDSKSRALNSTTHLMMAFKIREIDSCMSLFRLLTAEEEVATAIFLSLKNHKYENARKLNPIDHKHKMGLLPFLSAVEKELWRGGLSKDGIRSIWIEGKIKKLGIEVWQINHNTNKEDWVRYEIPLNFIVERTDDRGKEKSDFSDSFNEIVSDSNAKTIFDYIRNRANQRNHVLYANSGTLPASVGNLDTEIARAYRRVFFLLKIYLLVDQYPQKQALAQQCLNAYLKILKIPEIVE